MIEQNASTSNVPPPRGCRTLFILVAIFAILLTIGIPLLREQQRLSFERQKAEWRQRSFDRVKNGDHRALIMDSQLLPMLADDADCVANLEELDFSMTNITPEDSRFVSQLKNVKTIFFYDTGGADNVLQNARNLPIRTMGFDMARLSKDSLRSLSEFPDLTDVHFGHLMFPNEIAILNELPQRISVRIPHPAENELGYKERGEPRDAPETR